LNLLPLVSADLVAIQLLSFISLIGGGLQAYAGQHMQRHGMKII
jgi:hypothetical protein